MTFNSDERFVLVAVDHRTIEADRATFRKPSSSPSTELFCVASVYCGIHEYIEIFPAMFSLVTDNLEIDLQILSSILCLGSINYGIGLK
jgi:hypothetical protein